MKHQGPVICLAAMVCLFNGCLQAGTWTTEFVQGASGGKFSSLKMDKFGNAHVAYFDPSAGTINYSFWDHALNKWFNTTLDRGSGFCTLVLDSKERPHISYPEGSNKIKYTFWDGSTWQKRVADIQARVINYYTSIALDREDNPSISFYEETGMEGEHRLRMVTWNGKFWELRTVDSDLGAGKFNSLAIDSRGNPQLAYADVEYQNASLRYARWNGHSWDIEILEGAGQPGTNMWSVSLLVDKNDTPYIVYTDVRKGLVRYATKVSGKWLLRDVGFISKVAYPDRNGIALDEQGKLYISYFDGGAGVLKIAQLDGDKWNTQLIDRGFFGFASSVQIFGGWIWVTYSDPNGTQLKAARSKIDESLIATPQARK